MRSIDEIRDDERRYAKFLNERLKSDKRLTLSCPEFQYPEPLYFYVKSVKTAKTLAVRIDGEDRTMRFWDYVDDGYENEDGVWARMNDKGFEEFIVKLYAVMDRAVDIEFYGADGITDDYYAGVTEEPLDGAMAQKLLKDNSDGIEFVFAKVSNFYGDLQYVFDGSFKEIKR